MSRSPSFPPSGTIASCSLSTVCRDRLSIHGLGLGPQSGSIGHGAAGIQMNPDGKLAYVACTPDSYVTIIDLNKLEVAGHLNGGKQPDGLWWVERH